MAHWVDVAIGAGGVASVVAVVVPFLARHASRNLRHTIDEVVGVKLDKVRTDLTSSLNRVSDDVSHRFDMNDAETRRAAETVAGMDRRLVKIETQFGPNGGGMRQAVDEMSREVSAVRSAQEGQDKRFEDHLRQAADDRSRLGKVEAALLNRGVQQQ